MAYCTTTDVQALNPKRPAYGALTTPTVTQVQSFVDSIGAEIDAIIEGRGYTAPVTALTTSTKFVAWLLALNARGAAALAEQAMFPDRAGMMGAPGSSSVYWAQYKEGIAFLKTCTIPGSNEGNALPFGFMEMNGMGDEEPGSDTPAWARPKFGINKEF